MKHSKDIIILSYIMCLFFLMLGIPMALEMIEPNSAYGVRIQRTLENPDVWYAVNKAAGISMIIMSIISVPIIALLKKHWGTETEFKILTITLVPAIFVVGTTTLIAIYV